MEQLLLPRVLELLVATGNNQVAVRIDATGFVSSGDMFTLQFVLVSRLLPSSLWKSTQLSRHSTKNMLVKAIALHLSGNQRSSKPGTTQ